MKSYIEWIQHWKNSCWWFCHDVTYGYGFSNSCSDIVLSNGAIGSLLIKRRKKAFHFIETPPPLSRWIVFSSSVNGINNNRKSFFFFLFFFSIFFFYLSFIRQTKKKKRNVLQRDCLVKMAPWRLLLGASALLCSLSLSQIEE